MSEARDTRERIKQVAMELFSEQGYDGTSLREIAERLGLTKAALYYHFKTKDDIALSYFDDFNAEVTGLCEWAREQEPSLDTRREMLRRYSDLLATHGPTMRFMHHNQPALQRLQKEKGSNNYKERMRQLNHLLVASDAPMIQRLRAVDAILTMHIAWFVELEGEPTPEELQQPALDIAMELLDTNERELSAANG
ncbi:MAG TPA: helix-turn-helix domain-containing protein [Stackebrandtia sp.]|jgi:AcrR family transcriptional regulator|uniref:TetR/AcrR family transcriptional regulator n=1 Tax=Stackebrandtia sp. TaxID=2023065 RepID=UPI002D338663|nr:helix-turn-helix domain-containing protein [Stackebrandtia sp.]HZE38113.1 helix-turn-helix domain-containing protein [Stackebrandtia sp.]